MKLPSNWNKTSLKYVAEVRSGIAKGKSDLKSPVTLPYLRVANVQDGYINLDEVKVIEVEKDKIDRYSLKKGDVLMNEGGDFDKLGRGDVWLGQIEPCLHQNHVFAVRPDKKKIDSFFLSALAASNYGKTYFLNCAKRSTNLASINSTQIKEFPVLIPPLPEQKKIAQILSTWDKAITTTEQLLANSQQQKKVLMQQLLTGKKRLLDENRVRFSNAWEKGNLSDLGNITKGKALSTKDIVNGDYPVIAGGKKSPYTHNNFTHEDIITVSASGAYAGYVSYHPYKLWASDCSVISPKSNSDIIFIFHTATYLQERIYSLQSGGAQPHIYPKDLKALKINIPTLKEQKKIAAVLSSADKEITVLQQKLDMLKQEKKALMQQLLTGKRRVKVEEAA